MEKIKDSEYLNKKRENVKNYDPLHPFTHISKKLNKGIKVVIPFKSDQILKIENYKKDCFEHEILILKNNIQNLQIENDLINRKEKIGIFITFSESSKMNELLDFIKPLFVNIVISKINTFLMISGDLMYEFENLNKIITNEFFEKYFISKISIRFYTYYDLLFFDQAYILKNDKYKLIKGFSKKDNFDKKYINEMKSKMRRILREKKNEE